MLPGRPSSAGSDFGWCGIVGQQGGHQLHRRLDRSGSRKCRRGRQSCIRGNLLVWHDMIRLGRAGELWKASSGGVGWAISSIPVVSSLFFLSENLHCDLGKMWDGFWRVRISGSGMSEKMARFYLRQRPRTRTLRKHDVHGGICSIFGAGETRQPLGRSRARNEIPGEIRLITRAGQN